ncbi:hypothetical protein G6O67_005659 [Ophiocordyceps sinensis]|uniref:Uncharacterized protein n=1 Tax=Ophiocordyceps sinensis TaxID=72228 RepID=A0A8H4PNF9_9HYPO|nr:hypothetical protein G6O67_005659 [Ophiocordyceps sinensis]
MDRATVNQTTVLLACALITLPSVNGKCNGNTSSALCSHGVLSIAGPALGSNTSNSTAAPGSNTSDGHNAPRSNTSNRIDVLDVGLQSTQDMELA